jgi:hypothetical protein
MTIYQANRREVVFDINHPAFSAVFEALLGRTDAHSFDDVATLTVEAARQRLASFVGPWQTGCSTINQCSRHTNHSSATSDTICSM